MNSKIFNATIIREGSTCFIPLDFDPKSLFGKVRAPVRVDKREVKPPADFVRALRASPPAWERWRELSYSHQREHVEAIADARKRETRARRIVSSVRSIRLTPKRKR